MKFGRTPPVTAENWRESIPTPSKKSTPNKNFRPRHGHVETYVSGASLPIEAVPKEVWDILRYAQRTTSALAQLRLKTDAEAGQLVIPKRSTGVVRLGLRGAERLDLAVLNYEYADRDQVNQRADYAVFSRNKGFKITDHSESINEYSTISPIFGITAFDVVDAKAVRDDPKTIFRSTAYIDGNITKTAEFYFYTPSSVDTDHNCAFRYVAYEGMAPYDSGKTSSSLLGKERPTEIDSAALGMAIALSSEALEMVHRYGNVVEAAVAVHSSPIAYFK